MDRQTFVVVALVFGVIFGLVARDMFTRAITYLGGVIIFLFGIVAPSMKLMTVSAATDALVGSGVFLVVYFVVDIVLAICSAVRSRRPAK